MQKQVVIDCFPESAQNYRRGYAIVAVDVIRATTSAITIAARGGRCIPASSMGTAFELRNRLRDPLMAGEIGGDIAPGFDINNSPTELAARDLNGRPVVLLSSSGTRLICESKGCDTVYLACFRNYGTVARYLVGRHSCIAVIGAGSRGEFREEDQMCCAWIARDLAEMGYATSNRQTLDIIKRWSYAGPNAARNGKSADYLRRSGQTSDLEFILSHINDLYDAYVMQEDEVIVCPDIESVPVCARNNADNTMWEALPPC